MSQVVDAISRSPAIRVDVIGIGDSARVLKDSKHANSKIGIVDEYGIGFGLTSCSI
jgi:hypothetical protein